MNLSELLFRIATGFITLFILTRIIGRKEISQMTFLNFVSGIAVGSIAADFIINEDTPLRDGVIALLVWTFLTLIIDLVDIKFNRARIVTMGKPLIIIKDGKIQEKELKKGRLDLDNLRIMLRQKNIFEIAEVEYAIFETNGSLSVLPKESNQTVTKSDMNISTINKYPIATEIISDGKIISKNLSKLNLNKDWLNQELNQSGVNSIEDIFYAEVQKDGTLYINIKESF